MTLATIHLDYNYVQVLVHCNNFLLHDYYMLLHCCFVASYCCTLHQCFTALDFFGLFFTCDLGFSNLLLG